VSRRGLIFLAVLALLVVPLACGDSGGEEQPEVRGEADSEDVRVIDEWADALRRGDVAAASRHFHVPSIAQNATAPIQLDTRSQVLLFNASLPCGAILTEAEDAGAFTIATFELTERPGPGECGAGTGGTARTAFRIERGLIVEWRRVVDEPREGDADDGPVV
jgi:hypothetical protein